MKLFLWISVAVLANAHYGASELRHVKTKVGSAEQAQAAQEVVKRILPARYTEFLVRVQPDLLDSRQRELFKVEWNDILQKVVISGSSGVTALFGFNYFLKYHCKCHISWEGTQVRLPSVLPRVEVEQVIFDRFRYYQNACTDSYSFVWWDWEQWEKHIDWMALNGINLPLAFTGQEAIWLKVYEDLGLSIDDILNNYIAGPAFLAWWRMGNIQSWGGPLTRSFLEGKLSIFKQIVARMRSLGMTPVLPAFSGNVPKSLTQVFPNASVAHHSSWNNFNSTYSSTYMLQPTDPLFIEIGKRFIIEMVRETGGTDHIYSCDTFNENRPIRNDSEFLSQMARSTYLSMAAADRKAVWVIQSWVFTDMDFWKMEQIRSYLSGIETGNALILDLEAELFPLYRPYESFFNHSFIWCMLHNFGGTHGMYGALDLVNEGVPTARRESATIVGSGMCPEGINQNYFIYDFMSEASLRESPVNVTRWSLDYQERRYGVESASLRTAWKLLTKSIYNGPPLFKFHGRTLITRRPNLKLKEKIWYSLDDVIQTLENFIAALENETESIPVDSLYYFDLVDVTRQFLQVLTAQLYKQLMGHYYAGELDKFEQDASRLLSVMDDLEEILGTNVNFLLGPWIEDALRWGVTPMEKEQLRFNALNQVTLWGPNGEIVDYAAKQWSGMISDYYRPRWSSFLTALRDSFGKKFDYNHYRQEVLRTIEVPFTLSNSSYPTIPTGDAFTEAKRIYLKWRDHFKNLAAKSKLQRKGIKTIPRVSSRSRSSSRQNITFATTTTSFATA